MHDLQLTPEHLDMLYRSGITDDVIASIGYRSIEEPDDMTGLRSSPLPALYVPLHRPNGELGGYQLRPDIPEPNAKGKTLKYLNPPGQASVLDCPPIMRDQLSDEAIPLIITEGSKKAAAAASRGYLCISLCGVSNWQREKGHALGDWQDIALNGRTVAICYDSDVMEKAEVKTQARKLGRYLSSSRGARVRFILLPNGEDGEKMGLDDWLAANPTGSPFDHMVTELPDDLGTVLEKTYTRTHQGNAERIADQYGDTIAWCPSTGWRAWNGKVWVRDAEHVVRRLVQSLRDLISADIETMQKMGVSDEEIGKHNKLLYECQSGYHQRAVMGMLEPLVTVEWSEFDTDPNKITVGNGTLVLGPDGVELRGFDPADRITRMTSTPYVPSARAPFFEQTMIKAQPDESQRAFVQRAIGYSLLGGQGEQVLFINYGTGANLKSTFLSGVRHALGEWYAEIDPATLKQNKQSGSAPSPDKIRLMGTRVVTATETNDSGGSVDTEFLKRVAGGEEIVARQLHGKTISFRPDFTLWLSMNHLPKLNDSSEGMWRRVHVIDWPYFVPPDERVDALTVDQRLASEAVGILRWIVEGYRAYRFLGLNPPESVKARTAKMRDDLDWFGQFCAERVIPEDDHAMKQSELWREFDGWRKGDSSLKAVGKSDFLAKARERYGDPVSVKGIGLAWRGFRLPTLGE